MKKRKSKWTELGLCFLLFFSFSLSVEGLPQKKRRNTRVITLSVEGMSCNSCVNKVTNALENLDGVRSAKVVLKTKSAKVKYNPDSVELDSILKAVKDVGFTAAYDPDANALLKGTIIDGLSGAPVSKADVSWIFRHYDEKNKKYVDDYKFDSVTDDNGKYAFGDIPRENINKEYTFAVKIKSQDYMEQEFSYRESLEDKTKVLNFGLLGKNKSKVYRGRIFVPTNEKPIEDASVKVNIVNRESSETVKTYQGKSKKDGTFQVEVPASEMISGKNYPSLAVEKEGYEYLVFDSQPAKPVGEIKEHLSNFAVSEYEYQFASADDEITIQGTVTDEEGETLKDIAVDFSGIKLTKTCNKGCCGDPAVHDVENTNQIKTDSDGNFSFKTNARYLYGLKYGLKVIFDGDEKIYRAIFKKGEDKKSREIETDKGNLLELRFSVKADG